uniref:C2H2-type domain-containing protein n=1 Tax=Knipowitschia caucasica TaxID=637954 RepID=A0AAV2ME49_KNICA
MDSSMESEARMILQEPCLVEEDSLCEVDHDDTLIIALDEVEEHTITTEPTPNMRSAQSENQPEPNTVSQLDRSHLEDEVKTKKTHSKLKKQEKAAKVGKKYVPSKKAMTDPLKIDMSKPLPLSSSQISLQCLECHIIFSDHKSKERHLKSSHPAEYEQSILRNALFACYVCDRHFTNSTELMTHQKAHVEKKPFKCPICAQTFSKLSELSVHKKVHFGQHGYTCTQCGKPCKTLTLLKYHCRTHTGERPYVCKECGKRFTMPKALQKHLDSHLPKIEGAPLPVYSCSVCKATFKSTKTRHCHMKKKHLSKSALNKTSGQIMKRCTPIITPISISQPSLLQVGPNGPLQKVDANIDTEQLPVLERDKTVEQESSTETAKEPLQQEHCEREREESPGIVLEKVVTTVITSVDKETSQTQDCENENQDIKMEESGADSTQRDIRTVLVKEEVRQTPQKELVVWNNKANSNSCSPAAIGVTETADSTAQNCSSSQCVFYPVKQEEREVLVGEMQRSSASTKTSHQSEQHTTDNVFAREEVMGPPGLGDLSDGQGQGTEEQSAPSLFDFLLQGSDEEDSTVEWSDPHVHTEEEIMANFYKKQSPSSNQSGISVSGTTTENIRRPIDYFSNYFDWDTWREISHFTNQAQNISTPVSIKEVAQFVGIHVAMGSLKFPNPRFYWEDLTKVPLIADAMPMMRFLELSRKLKLACPQVNDQNCSENRRDAVIGSSNDKQHNSQHLQQNSLVNSWLLYKRDVNSPLTLLAFRLEVSKALILASGLDAQDSVSNQTEEPPSLGDSPDPGPLHENSLPDAASRYDGLGHWPEQLAEGQGGRCRFGDLVALLLLSSRSEQIRKWPARWSELLFNQISSLRLWAQGPVRLHNGL